MQDDVSKGNAASRVLEDAVFLEAVQEVSKVLVDEWSKSTNPKRREELWAQQAALTKVVENLTAYVQNGEMQKRLTEEKEKWYKANV